MAFRVAVSVAAAVLVTGGSATSSTCPTDTGIVAVIVNAAPKCFETTSCSGTCPHMESVFGEFLMKGLDAASVKLCENEESWACLVTDAHKSDCAPALALLAEHEPEAGKLLPDTPAKLKESCAAVRQQVAPTSSPTALSASAPKVAFPRNGAVASAVAVFATTSVAVLA